MTETNGPGREPRFCPNGRECFRQHLLDRADEMIREMDDPVPAPPAAPPEPAADADGLIARLDAQLSASNIAALKENPQHLRGPLGGLTIVAREARSRLVELEKEANDLRSWGRGLKAEVEQQARELAELREQRDNARAVTRDICEEWNEECDCEKLPMALGHGEQCKAVSIRVAKAALRERVERAEADLAAARAVIAAADAREVLEVRAVFDSWRKNEVCPSEWGAFFAGYQRGVAATKGSSEPGLHIPGTPTHTIEGLPACVQETCAEDVAKRLPDKGRAAANEAATCCAPAGANPAPSPDVEQMLKYSRKQLAQRQRKLLAKHGKETLAAVRSAKP